jgi:hypothetical protein|nr:MAG TPA: hypothetical protein [Caudoviricetes sp.]
MQVYEPLTQPDEITGKFYKTYEIPDGVPLNGTLLNEAPPEDIKFPKWDYTTSKWIEDKDSIIKQQDETIKDLSFRLGNNEVALMEALGLMSSEKGE